MPIPLARAIGLFAIKPMHNVMMAAPKQVAVSAASNGMPASERIVGLTAMMYAIAKKVVRPPIISELKEDLRSEILKNLSTSAPFPFFKKERETIEALINVAYFLKDFKKAIFQQKTSIRKEKTIADAN